MQKSEQINELATALSKAQGKIKGAVKDSSNPFFKSKYADLASVWEACRVPLSENGLSIVQTANSDGDKVKVVTMLLHNSGQWIMDELGLIPTANTPQAFGSAITYGRRYGLQSMVGISPEDDDGNAASGQISTPKTTLTTAQKNQVHADSLRYLESGDEVGLMETWHGFGADEKTVLWAMFNSEQRSAMKKMMGTK